jgi:hypothetical protein
MLIDKIDYVTEYYSSVLTPTKPVAVKFPRRYEEGQGCGFASPTWTLHDALIWAWLQWHNAPGNSKSICEILSPVIKRSIELIQDKKVVQYFREKHDSFLTQLAVLTGSKALMNTAAHAAEEGQEESGEYQFYSAWTGILKYRIFGDEPKVREQYEIYQRYKPLRAFLFPTKKMMQSFVEKDYKTLNKVIRQRCEEHWKWSAKMGALEDQKDGTKVLHLDKYDPNFLWPWVEGTFAKLAYMDGAEITYDSPWLPLGLVKAIGD